MTSLPEWVDQVRRAWVAFGLFLGFTGLKLPAFLPDNFFGDEFIGLVISAFGAFIAVVQFLRKDADEEVKSAPSSLSAHELESAKQSFRLNPFKLRVYRAAA